MLPEKPKKGYLSSVFKKAVLTGLTALTLTTGMMSTAAYAQPGNGHPGQDGFSASEVARQPWEQNTNYIREMDAARLVYEANVDAIRQQENATVSTLQNNAWKQATKNHKKQPLLRIVFNVSSNGDTTAGYAQAHATALSRQASLLSQYIRQQENIEDKYKRDYERQHPQWNIPSVAAPVPKSFEAQKQEVCQRRALQELSAHGRDLPTGDACKAILDAPPKL